MIRMRDQSALACMGRLYERFLHLENKVTAATRNSPLVAT